MHREMRAYLNSDGTRALITSTFFECYVKADFFWNARDTLWVHEPWLVNRFVTPVYYLFSLNRLFLEFCWTVHDLLKFVAKGSIIWVKIWSKPKFPTDGCPNACFTIRNSSCCRFNPITNKDSEFRFHL